MTALHFVANTITAATEVTRNGKNYLVSPVVAIREGVLNGALVPLEEFAKYFTSWEGRSIPIRHPQINGEYVSANLLEVKDTHVIGCFQNVYVEGDRLLGELWIDLELAEQRGDDGVTLVNRLRAGDPVEVSTGYFADLEETAGMYKGKRYFGIHRNIRPDHLALLPDEIGACSWEDGCGTPRVNQKGKGMGLKLGVITHEMTLDDRAMVVRRAFWEQVASVGEEPYNGDWDVLAVFEDTLIAKDWTSKGHVAFPYTLAEGGAVTFGVATPVEVVYRAQEGGAEIVVANRNAPVSGNEIGLFARIKQWVTASKVEGIAVQQQEEVDVKKCELVTALVANKQVKFSKEQLEKLDEGTLQGLHDSLVANQEATPAATIVPAFDLGQLKEMIQGIVGEAIAPVMQTITANADRERNQLIAGLVANEACPLDEADLKAMSLEALNKLASSYLPRDYSGGAGVFYANASEEWTEMPMPKVNWVLGQVEDN